MKSSAFDFAPPKPSYTDAQNWDLRQQSVVAPECQQEALMDGLKLNEASGDVALAKLVDPRCPRVMHLSFEPPADGPVLDGPSLVNKWIESIDTVGQVGTDMSPLPDIADAAIAGAAGLLGSTTIPVPPAELPIVNAAKLVVAGSAAHGDRACHVETDYDMGLVVLLRILYKYAPTGLRPPSPEGYWLEFAALDHAIDVLLTQSGGADQWSEHPQLCHVTVPIPETENHILMTETARYLTNQLIRQHLNPGHTDAKDQETNYRYVNAKNGLKEKMLEFLQHFLAQDFHEYNARPYARVTAMALEDLYDFADDIEVRRGARLGLDYISAKFAVSNLEMRRSVPSPPAD